MDNIQKPTTFEVTWFEKVMAWHHFKKNKIHGIGSVLNKLQGFYMVLCNDLADMLWELSD